MNFLSASTTTTNEATCITTVRTKKYCVIDHAIDSTLCGINNTCMYGLWIISFKFLFKQDLLEFKCYLF